MSLIKKNYCTRSVLVFAALALSPGLMAHTSSVVVEGDRCAELARRISFAQLESRARHAFHVGEGQTPALMRRAFPEGLTLLTSSRVRDIPDGMSHRNASTVFVAAKAHFNVNGVDYYPTVMFDPAALTDNLFRDHKSLIPEDSQGALLHGHGGGTWGADASTAGVLGGYSANLKLTTVSIDWPGHGDNFPTQFSTVPKDYDFYSLHFMYRYMNDGKPLALIGHSRGGQEALQLFYNYTMDDVKREFPGLNFKLAIAMSPPVDRTEGGTLADRSAADAEEFNSPVAEYMLQGDMINLPSQIPMRDVSFGYSMTPELLKKRKNVIPTITIMGDKDDICFLGCETIYYRYVQDHPQIAEKYLYSDVVDYSGKKQPPNHIIPKFQLVGQSALPGVGASMPAAYAHALQGFMRYAMGQKNYDIFSPAAKNLLTSTQVNEADQIRDLMKWRESRKTPISLEKATEEVQKINALRAFKSNLTNIFGKYASNLIFREFIKSFRLSRTVTTSKTLSEGITSYLSSLDKFNQEARMYAKSLTIKSINANEPENWALFFDWMKHGSDEKRAEAEALTERWGQSDSEGQKFAAHLLALTLGENFQEYRRNSETDLPETIPVNNHTILESLRTRDIASAAEDIEGQSKLLLGYRDIGMNALAQKYTELQPLAYEQTLLQREHSSLESARSAALLGNLIRIDAQRQQLHKLFLKEDSTMLARKGAEIERMTQEIPDASEIKTSDYLVAVRIYQSFVDKGWQHQAFESYMGPDMRNTWSGLDKALKSIDLEEKLVGTANDLNAAFDDFIGAISGRRIDSQVLQEAVAFYDSLYNAGLIKEPTLFSAIRIKQEDATKNPEAFVAALTKMSASLKQRNKDRANRVVKGKAAFAPSWNATVDQMFEFAATIRGASDHVKPHSPKLEELRGIRQHEEDKVKQASVRYWSFTGDFMKKNQDKWSPTSRPSYPAELFRLEAEYQEQQRIYQAARRTYAAEERKLAATGELGPYLQFIYSKFDELESQMSRISGHTDDNGSVVAIDSTQIKGEKELKAQGEVIAKAVDAAARSGKITLSGSENRLQEIESRLAEIQDLVVHDYLGALYVNKWESAWELLDDPDHLPTTDQMNRILGAWNRIARELRTSGD
ncbi:MAG TPA: alpha/beta fold hydrolase [Bdellovibrionota bacterium]|jgi:acetyl esterase/lipase|nr:alpha/beta fold hydrolase [Bdellovibrionota bacterium]